jgi:hypothetical protein
MVASIPRSLDEILTTVVPSFFLMSLAKYTNSTVPIPEFPIEPDVALELLMAANYLDV